MSTPLVPPENAAAGLPAFTASQLRRFDGQEEDAALVAFDGVVYDVSASRRWRDGLHEGQHFAGQDLTSEISEAPHGPEVLQRAHIRRAGVLLPPT